MKPAGLSLGQGCWKSQWITSLKPEVGIVKMRKEKEKLGELSHHRLSRVSEDAMRGNCSFCAGGQGAKQTRAEPLRFHWQRLQEETEPQHPRPEAGRPWMPDHSQPPEQLAITLFFNDSWICRFLQSRCGQSCGGNYHDLILDYPGFFLWPKYIGYFWRSQTLPQLLPTPLCDNA